MRLSKDNTNWNATSIICRDFRHTHGHPEIPKHLKKRGKKSRAHKANPRCKHVWVKVEYAEYRRYNMRLPRSWWVIYGDDPYWTEYETYYVCAGCLETKSKYDKGKMRQYYRKRRASAWPPR
jgi:hypothetical protein